VVLLIAFKYPPYEGVGGNRWMNLAHHLARIGCEIHVVTVRWRASQRSPWGTYTPEAGVHVHRIASGFPHNLYHSRPGNIALRFARKVVFSRHLLRRIWWDDEAQYWGRYLFPYCKRLARRVNFDVVIATGHPFESNYLAVGLSRKLGLPLVQDLRDPWIDNPYSHYTQRQRDLLVPKVRAVLCGCDRVVTVTQGLMEVYAQYCDLSAKGVVIRNGHGIDISKWNERTLPVLKRRDPLRIRLVYIGNISNGREEPFEWLLSAINRLRYRESGVINVDVYGLEQKKLKQRYSHFLRTGSLILCNPVAHGEIAKVLKRYDAAIHLTARAFPYAASTKIYEYAASGIPTISLNYGGEAEQLVRDLDCGISINLTMNGTEKAFQDAICSPHRQFQYRVERYHWRRLSRRYLNVVRDVLAERAKVG